MLKTLQRLTIFIKYKIRQVQSNLKTIDLAFQQFKSKIKLKVKNMQHINSYIEYCNIVGDNGGIMMSEKEFQEYKKKHQAAMENRLYTVWVNSNKEQCKNVGLSAKCFCDHLYKNHDYLGQNSNKVKCKTAGCKCADYVYLPITGSQDIKCTCKHSYQTHDLIKKNCKNCTCKQFISNWACSCGMKYSEHKTVSSKAGGKKNMQSIHPTQGKITSFSSMLDKVDRHQQDIKQQVKKQGLKVVIQDFSIGKLQLKEQKSSWQLYTTPIAWLK